MLGVGLLPKRFDSAGPSNLICARAVPLYEAVDLAADPLSICFMAAPQHQHELPPCPAEAQPLRFGQVWFSLGKP